MSATRRPYLRSERTISQYSSAASSPSARRASSPGRSSYAMARVATSPRRAGSRSPARRAAVSPVRYTSPARARQRAGAASPVRTHRDFGRQPEDSTMQLPIQIVVDALPPPASTPGAATASRPPSAVFEMKLANAGRRTDRTYTDQDDTAAANLFASQFRDQLRDASRSGVGDGALVSSVCPRCKSESTRLYAGRVCPRCLATDVGSADVARMIAGRSARGVGGAMGSASPPPMPSRDRVGPYSPASRRSELNLTAREAEASQAEERLSAVLRRAPPDPRAVSASRAGAASALVGRRRGELEGESLHLGFASRSSPRLELLLQDFPDDSPSRAGYRTPHSPRTADSRLGELTVDARARTLSFS
jgi:hypothetical protein